MPEYLVLLEGVDIATGSPLPVPTALNADQFIKLLTDYQENEIGISFATSNTYVLFDELNLPVVVRRFYVPWQ